jgi:hypothetical protein
MLHNEFKGTEKELPDRSSQIWESQGKPIKKKTKQHSFYSNTHKEEMPHTCPNCYQQLTPQAVKKEGPNQGKNFVSCKCPSSGAKGYFAWVGAAGETAKKRAYGAGPGQMNAAPVMQPPSDTSLLQEINRKLEYIITTQHALVERLDKMEGMMTVLPPTQQDQDEQTQVY